jgi:hypothetical protein
MKEWATLKQGVGEADVRVDPAFDPKETYNCGGLIGSKN